MRETHEVSSVLCADQNTCNLVYVYVSLKSTFLALCLCFQLSMCVWFQMLLSINGVRFGMGLLGEEGCMEFTRGCNWWIFSVYCLIKVFIFFLDLYKRQKDTRSNIYNYWWRRYDTVRKRYPFLSIFLIKFFYNVCFALCLDRSRENSASVLDNQTML